MRLDSKQFRFLYSILYAEKEEFLIPNCGMTTKVHAGVSVADCPKEENTKRKIQTVLKRKIQSALYIPLREITLTTT